MIRPGQNNTSGEGFQISAMWRGLAWAIVVTVIMTILFSVLLHYTSLTEGLLSSYALFIIFISMLTGATMGAKTAGNKGLWHGLSITLGYWLLTVIIALFWNLENLTFLFLLKRLCFAVAAGVLGGIIGIGFSK